MDPEVVILGLAAIAAFAWAISKLPGVRTKTHKDKAVDDLVGIYQEANAELKTQLKSARNRYANMQLPPSIEEGAKSADIIDALSSKAPGWMKPFLPGVKVWAKSPEGKKQIDEIAKKWLKTQGAGSQGSAEDQPGV